MSEPLTDNIPVLTEIVSRGEKHVADSFPPLDLDTEDAPNPSTESTRIPSPLTPQAKSTLELENAVVDRVLQEMLGTVDTELSATLAQSVNLVVQAASEQLMEDIRASLHSTISHAVTVAVRKELEKLIFEKENNL